MARRSRGQGAQGRAEGRVRGRVQERVRGREKRGGTGRKQSTLDLDAIEGYANRLAHGSRGISGSGLAGAAPGLAGAASALAGRGLASRFTASATQGSEEDFRKEVAERFALIEERLLRLEEQVQGVGQLEGTGDPAEPEGGTSPDTDQ